MKEKIWTKIGENRGAAGFGMIIAGMVLLTAYMMYPEAFHSFFQFIQDQFFQNLDSSFDDDPFAEKGGGEPKSNK